MATIASSIATSAQPLPCSEQQARILQASLGQSTHGQPIQFEDGFTLEPWECTLLSREAREDSVRGVARTLLRARAAEWAVLRRLAESRLGPEDAESVAALLDQTIVDIGVAMEVPTCGLMEVPNTDEAIALEPIAQRLADLYEQVEDMSLRLLRRRRGSAAPSLKLLEMTEDPFELGELVHDDPGQPMPADAAEERESWHPPKVTDAPALFGEDQIIEIEAILGEKIEHEAISEPREPAPQRSVPEKAAQRTASSPPARQLQQDADKRPLKLLMIGLAVIAVGVIAALIVL